jgi:hypothetical protein
MPATRLVSDEVSAVPGLDAWRTEMRWPVPVIGATVVLLLLADFLAFHDLLEAHAVRDWMVLVATGLAVIALVGESMRMAARHHT